jgi:hypothetical protein
MHEHRRRSRTGGIEIALSPIVDPPEALTMARPSKLTSEAIDRFCEATAAAAWPEAAVYAGFSPASYYRYLRGSTPEHLAFRMAALKVQTELEIRLSGTLVQGAMADPSWPSPPRASVLGAMGPPIGWGPPRR